MTHERMKQINAVIGAILVLALGSSFAIFRVTIVDYLATRLREEPLTASQYRLFETVFLWVGICLVILGIASLWTSIARLLTSKTGEPVPGTSESSPADRLMKAAVVVGGITTGLIGIYFAVETYSSGARRLADRSEPFASLPLFVSALAFGLLAIALFRRRS